MSRDTQIQSKNPVILIVDDNPQNLQVLGKLLQDNQYVIEFATNGPAALDWLNIRPFDLILLDINMPGMSGFEVCRKIRKNPQWNNIPVIFLSADTDRESILKGFELGAQDYISKPFDSRELLVRTGTHLNLKNSLERLERLNKSLEEKVQARTLQLNDANNRLEATNLLLIDLDKSKSEFLKLISHEIRTPLNGIVGPLEILKDQGFKREIGDLVEILDLSVKRLERFALDAVLITQLQTKSIFNINDKIILSEVINKILIEEKEKFEAKNINVRLKQNLNEATVMGNAELIKKCITNIIDNAVRFSPQNGELEILIFADGNLVSCEIHDQGVGFAQPLNEDLFKLFISGEENSDNHLGTGLSIAKMIMELHAGDVKLDNRADGGAVVKLSFLN